MSKVRAFVPFVPFVRLCPMALHLLAMVLLLLLHGGGGGVSILLCYVCYVILFYVVVADLVVWDTQCAFCKKEIVATNQTQKKVHAETHDQKVWTKEKCWPDDTFA